MPSTEAPGPETAPEAQGGLGDQYPGSMPASSRLGRQHWPGSAEIRHPLALADEGGADLSENGESSGCPAAAGLHETGEYRTVSGNRGQDTLAISEQVEL